MLMVIRNVGALVIVAVAATALGAWAGTGGARALIVFSRPNDCPTYLSVIPAGLAPEELTLYTSVKVRRGKI